eukprot:m.33085 g.33085  ORF g.33085 m.33085 type:complete len:247 (-) comp12829_c0_seq1:75-815(-)
MSGTTNTEAKMRPPIAAKERGPGPARYQLPSSMGAQDKTKKADPAFSFGAKIPDNTKSQSPGPGYYINPKLSRHGPAGAPAFSMAGRPKETKKVENPPPGAYAPDKVNVGKKAPAFSMGTRTNPRKVDQTPGPTAYSLPTAVGGKTQAVKSAPAASFGSKPKKGGFADDLAKTPGPGSYSAAADTKKKAPAFSMGARSKPLQSKQQTPGPGSHDPKLDSIKKKQPGFSMGVRHSEYTTSCVVDVPH